jgi:hypothetical protein
MRLFGGLALASAAVASAQAQSAPHYPAPPDQTAGASQAQYAPPPATAQSALAAGVNTSTGPIPADQMPPGQAAALAAGDNHFVSNGPIPDTPANRAKYGGPKSHGGRATAPIGN